MKSAKKYLLLCVSIVMTAALSSCNLPFLAPTDPNILALTIVAQTEQARAQSPAETPTPSAPTAAPVSSQPTVGVNTATNCRTGPGPQYDFVMLFQPGMTAQVVGKYTASNYWIILMSNGGTCWLWGQYATVQGDVSQLQEMTPPQLVIVQPTPVQNKGNGNTGNNNPTPTATKSIVLLNPNIIKVIKLPAAPSSLTVHATCKYTTFPTKLLLSRTDSLSWTSMNGATGYKLYMNGSPLTQVSGTSYQNTPPLTASKITYAVAAYNSIGTSSKTSASAGCP